LASNTQATLPLWDAATRFDGKGELITCSSVKFAALAASEEKKHSKKVNRNGSPDRRKIRVRNVSIGDVSIGEEAYSVDL
jgi:hypothetical protein